MVLLVLGDKIAPYKKHGQVATAPEVTQMQVKPALLRPSGWQTPQ
jgi:hypothetical protein